MNTDTDHNARCRECNRNVGWASSGLPSKELTKIVSKWVGDGLVHSEIELELAKAETWGHVDGCERDPLNVGLRAKNKGLFK